MLRKEQNELLTRTGSGTPMGELFRRYWLPALMVDELPENDCPPVRIKILGEDLLALRDSEGRYGLVEEFCPHRRVSLWFGRNEECGIRCSYHGWKFDVTGKCIDIPSEPDDSPISNRTLPNSNSLPFRSRTATSPSVGRNAITCRPWRAESIPAMSPGFTASP